MIMMVDDGCGCFCVLLLVVVASASCVSGCQSYDLATDDTIGPGIIRILQGPSLLLAHGRDERRRSWPLVSTSAALVLPIPDARRARQALEVRDLHARHSEPALPLRECPTARARDSVGLIMIMLPICAKLPQMSSRAISRP